MRVEARERRRYGNLKKLGPIQRSVRRRLANVGTISKGGEMRTDYKSSVRR